MKMTIYKWNWLCRNDEWLKVNKMNDLGAQLKTKYE